MRYPTEAKWGKWGISDECHKFYVLHWSELFEPETPDTWQVRTCNIITMLGEIIDGVRAARIRDRARRSLRSILDETFQVMDRDVIIKKNYSFVSPYLEAWRGDRPVEQGDLAELERLATVILGNLRNYWDKGVEHLLKLLRVADKLRKKELYDTTMNVAVATTSRGISPAYLLGLLDEIILVDSQLDFVDRVSDMFKRLAQTERHFECVFWTKGVRLQLKNATASAHQTR